MIYSSLYLICLCHFIHLSQPTTTKKATTTRKASTATKDSPGSKSKKTTVQTQSQTQLTFPPAGRSARAAASRARRRMAVSLISFGGFRCCAWVVRTRRSSFDWASFC